MGRTPVTQTRTSHAITIRSNGVTVGLINGWNPTQARTVTPIYEIGSEDSGNPDEYMPGNITGLQVNISRYDTYVSRMEQAFGTPDLVMLTRQNQPFDVIERWAIPDPILASLNKSFTQTNVRQISIGENRVIGIRGAQIPSPFVDEERFLYKGCWFTSLGRNLSSEGNRVVNVDATLVYTKKVKMTGLAGAAATI